MKLTEGMWIRNAIAIRWYRGKWQAVMLVSTLKHIKNEQVMSNQGLSRLPMLAI